jgi:predicted AAA+ superfamily ATPase
MFKTKKSILLLGPRQVGKSTLCQSLSPVKTVNLADEAFFLQYSKDPERLKREILAIQAPALIFIDEIQRIPSLLNTIQVLIDDYGKKYRFLLTGSSARKLKKGGANLLPGRVLLEYLDPMSYFEIEEKFDLNRALKVGMLPEVYLDHQEGSEILSTYTEVYLKEEIQAEALIKNIGSYARFLDIAAILSGQWLNYSKISSETEIPKETIRRFFSILEETLLVFRIPSFLPKQKINRRVTQKDKYFWFDVGVRNSILGLHKYPVSQDQVGFLFEHWFILQIIYLNRILKFDWIISTYRTESGAEVDLVIERNNDIIGLEIKASKNIGKHDLRGMLSLSEVIGKYKPFKKWIAYMGNSIQLFDPEISVIPYLEVLQKLKEEV